MYADESSMTIFLVLWGVWALVGLGLYLWYLAALSSLFPRIGLPGGEGWIPVWNESRILQRGGFSPWFVLLMFVPGVSIVFVVLRALAIHRIHTEFGKGAGLTVLAVLIPPLWATMLGGQLRAEGYGAPAYAQAAAPAAPAAVPGGYLPPQPPASPQPVEPSPWAAPPAVPMRDEAPAYGAPAQYSAPVQPDPGYPAAPAPAYEAPTYQHPAAVTPEHQPLPDSPAFETLGFDSLMAQAAQSAGAPPAAPEQAPGAPAFSDPAPDAQWGFGRETEEAYQQLSTQEIQPLSLPFSAEAQPVEPFTWPGTVADMPPAPRSAEPFAVPESAWAAPTPVADPAPMSAPVPVQDPAAAPASSVSPATPVELPEAAVPVASATPAAAPAAQAETGLEEELDHTVFVSRAPRERWVLELPDGSLLPLPSNDVIVGRRPSSAGESSVLVIPDSTRTLSKSHVRLHVIDGAWVVTDLGSTNGLAVIDETGEELVVASGVSEPATEEMMFGTLRVRLRLVALDG